MRLCNYTVQIEIPDDYTIQKQDRALAAIDALGLIALIEAVVRDRLRETDGLRRAQAHVES